VRNASQEGGEFHLAQLSRPLVFQNLSLLGTGWRKLELLTLAVEVNISVTCPEYLTPAKPQPIRDNKFKHLSLQPGIGGLRPISLDLRTFRHKRYATSFEQFKYVTSFYIYASKNVYVRLGKRRFVA